MSARKPHFFYCEIYATNIYFCPGFSAEEMAESILDITGQDFQKDYSSLYGSTICVTGPKTGGVFVWVEGGEYGPKIANTITHESVHVANFILGCAGVGVTLDNDEAQAYLAGWVSKKITEYYFESKEDADGTIIVSHGADQIFHQKDQRK